MNLRNEFIKDIQKTIEVMQKNNLPSCKKQAIPPLYEFIPYCSDRKFKPTKRMGHEFVKDFYFKCNEMDVDIDDKMIIQMKAIILKGRQCMTKEDRYRQTCQAINQANNLIGIRSHADAKKCLAKRKRLKEEEIIEQAKKEKENEKEKEKEKELQIENREIPDSWDDDF